LTAGVAKGSVSFQVSDRGCGVAPENRPRLFELFFTTKPKGSGIGLALSRRYMEQAGGSLDYHEQPGGGSVFTARLPGSDA
jgi:two-component system NtrC family sensor kinase